jgi:lipopolysaccharide export system permease protein
VFGKILHRMILAELIKVFLLSLVTITCILLLAGIIAEASQQGLGPMQILFAIPHLIPSTLPYTIPATTLIATCVVYGRMAADNEILAIKSAGINIMTVVGPGVVLGIAMSLITLVLYYHYIPDSHARLRALVFDDADELLYSILKKQGYISHSSMPYGMWVKGVQGRKLLSPVFKRKKDNNEIDVIVAREADLHVDMQRREVIISMRDGTLDSASGGAYFNDHNEAVPLPEGFGSDSNRKPRDMTWRQLAEQRHRLEGKLDEKAVSIHLAIHQELIDGKAPNPKHLQDLDNQRKAIEAEIRALDVERHMRVALSIGCLFFILIGCPVGIWVSRSDFLSSFIISFMPIVAVYYPLLLCGTGMAKEGRFNLVLLVWGANIVIGTVGLGLFWRLLRN